MSEVHVTTRIEAPVERVWETVMDPARLEDWVTIQRWVRDVSDQPMRKGSEIALLAKDRPPPVASIEDMVAVAAQSIARTAWHGTRSSLGASRRQEESTLSRMALS